MDRKVIARWEVQTKIQGERGWSQRKSHVAAKEERCQQQLKEKDVRTEVMPRLYGHTQISRNGLIYKRGLANNKPRPLAK